MRRTHQRGFAPARRAMDGRGGRAESTSHPEDVTRDASSPIRGNSTHAQQVSPLQGLYAGSAAASLTAWSTRLAA
ncbi:MAG: hypothetical protein ACRD0K_22180 [Egibacteraceae bacterium]